MLSNPLGQFQALKGKDDFIYGHSVRVCELVSTFCQILHWRDIGDAKAICLASLYHDMGKLVWPEELRDDKVKLQEAYQQGMIEGHAKAGFDILKRANFPENICQMVLHHHEYWDGTGYPNHLEGDKIPLGSRIIKVADSYDAMTTRDYCKKTKEEALQELNDGSEYQFDPWIVKVFLEILKK